MPASLHEWVNRLKRQPLPAMALSVQSVSTLMARPSSSNADYRHIVARDPGFALSIFHHLGNLPKPPREPIASLSHALAMAGTAPLESGIEILPVIDAAADIDNCRGLLACYSRAAHAAIYVSQWGEVRKDSNPEELMLAALLHNCGEMALWCAAPDQMATFEIRVAKGMSRETASLAVFGFTLAQLSLELAQSWSLPPLICDSLSPDGAFRARPLGVLLASELALYSAATWDSEQTMYLIELAAEYCRQTTDQAAATLHSLSAESARRLHALDLPVSAIGLLQLQPRKTQAAEQSISQQTENVAESHTVLPPPAPESTAEKPAMITKTLSEAEPAEPDTGAAEAPKVVSKTPSLSPKPEVQNSAPPPEQRPTTSSLQLLLTGIMKQLRDNAGLERSMFAMLSPDRNSLRARFIIGAEKNAGIKTFQVSLDKRHLFSVVMSKPQSFWLNHGNRKKYLPAIPVYLHNALNTQGFFICSLFVDAKPVGILYADSCRSSNLNNGSFTYFKQLTQQLSIALSEDGKVGTTG